MHPVRAAERNTLRSGDTYYLMATARICDTPSKDHMSNSSDYPVTDPHEARRGKQLRALVAEHGRSVDALLRTLENDPRNREELWSDVFTIAYTHLDEIDQLSEGRVRGWILVTTRNLVANSARRATTRRRTVERLSREPAKFADSAEDDYFGALATPKNSQQVQAAWSTLNASHQEILVLDANGLNGRSIADRLGITHQGARSRLMRARKAFVAAYEAKGEPQP